MFHRLYVLPDLAEPVQRAQLLAALAVGKEIIRLGRAAPRFGLEEALNKALAAFVAGRAEWTMVKLLGYAQVLSGHVASIARAIDVADAQPNQLGLATVAPIFTWVRLAQRVPVRIRLDHVPPGIQLVAGMTATVEVDPARPAG